VASPETSTTLSDRVQSLRPSGLGQSSHGRLWIAVILCALLTGALAYLLFVGNPFKPAEEPDEDATPRRRRVRSPQVPRQTGREVRRVLRPVRSPWSPKGYIIPEQQILVSPQVSGRVIELNFDAGQRVEKDFVLAILDNTDTRQNTIGSRHRLNRLCRMSPKWKKGTALTKKCNPALN